MGGSTAFNGTTSTIPTTLTSNDVFKTGNGFTMWRWINPKNIGESGSGRIIDKTDADNGTGGVQWRLGSGNLAVVRIGNTTSRASADNSINFNRWQLALVTVAPDATVTHYINNNASGTPAATGALSGITTANPLTIGNRSAATDRTFDGLLGEGGICPRVLTEAERTAIFTGTQPIPSGTAHHWTLDEVTGVFVDTIGGATGTGTATTYSTDTPVQMKTAIDMEARSSLSFDGVDDYVTSVGTAGVLTGSNAVSICGELKLGANGTNDPNSLPCVETSNVRVYVRDTQNQLKVRFDNAGAVEATYNLGNGNRSWVKFVGVYEPVDASNSILRLYVNGQFVATTSAAKLAGVTSYADLIGKRAGASTYFKGNIRNVMVLSRVVTHDEVKLLHFGNIKPVGSVVYQYDTNEGAGDTVYDQSGNGNDGTITGATWSAELPNAPLVPIGGNLLKNGDFSYVPVVNVPTTTSNRYIDGTAGGSATNDLFVFSTSFTAGSTTNSCGFEYDSSLQKNVLHVSLNDVNKIAFATNAGGTTSRHIIRCTPGDTIRISGKMKTLYVSGDGRGAFIRVKGWYGSGVAYGAVNDTDFIKTTTGWTEYSENFTVPAGIYYLNVELYCWGQTITADLIMDAWFADISLTEVGATPIVPLTSGTTPITCP